MKELKSDLEEAQSKLKKEKEKRNREVIAAKVKVIEVLQDEINKVKTLNLIFGIYGLAVTILKATSSKRLTGDVARAGAMIADLFVKLINFAKMTGDAAWNLRNVIEIERLNVIVAGILSAVAYVLIVGGVLGAIGYAGFRLGRGFYRRFWDLKSLAIALGILAVIVWGADLIS
jgi:hypothetical protein